jgi:hypothetical protein
VRTKPAGVREAYQSRITHQVADFAIEMGACGVDVFPILDANQVRHFAG